MVNKIKEVLESNEELMEQFDELIRTELLLVAVIGSEVFPDSEDVPEDEVLAFAHAYEKVCEDRTLELKDGVFKMLEEEL